MKLQNLFALLVISGSIFFNTQAQISVFVKNMYRKPITLSNMRISCVVPTNGTKRVGPLPSIMGLTIKTENGKAHSLHKELQIILNASESNEFKNSAWDALITIPDTNNIFQWKEGTVSWSKSTAPQRPQSLNKKDLLIKMKNLLTNSQDYRILDQLITDNMAVLETMFSGPRIMTIKTAAHVDAAPNTKNIALKLINSQLEQLN